MFSKNEWLHWIKSTFTNKEVQNKCVNGFCKTDMFWLVKYNHKFYNYMYIHFLLICLYHQLIDWLIVAYTVLRPIRKYFIRTSTSLTPVLGLCSGPFSRIWSLSCHTCCDTFYSRFHTKDPFFSVALFDKQWAQRNYLTWIHSGSDWSNYSGGTSYKIHHTYKRGNIPFQNLVLKSNF